MFTPNNTIFSLNAFAESEQMLIEDFRAFWRREQIKYPLQYSTHMGLPEWHEQYQVWRETVGIPCP